MQKHVSNQLFLLFWSPAPICVCQVALKVKRSKGYSLTMISS